MTSRRPRRALLLVVGLLLAGVGVLFPAAPARAETPQVTVEITAISITGSEPEDDVELSASITNTGTVPVYGLRYAMWRSRDPIQDTSALWREVTTGSALGLTLYDHPRDESHGKVTEQNEAFAPGATATVTVRASLAKLGFDIQEAAYSVGLSALGYDQDSDEYAEVGRARTVVAVPGEQEVPVTRLVVLSSTPTKLTDGIFRNDDLLTELGGRLDILLDAAGGEGASWLIDPALIDELTDMADGYQVLHDGDLVEGTGSKQALDWLDRFSRLDRTHGARSLFANPDLTGAAASGDDQVLARALTAGDTVSALADLPLVVLPADGAYTAEISAGLAEANAAAVIATNLGVPGTAESADGTLILAATPDLDADLSDLQKRQYLITEALIAGASGQLRLLREPADLAVNPLASTSWMTPRKLSDLLDSAPTGDLAALQPTDVAVLEPGQFEAISELEQYFAAYGQLVPESALTGEAATVLTRAASVAWIGDAAGWNDLLSDIKELVGPGALASAVTLDAAPRFVMSSRANEFPVTVTNHLEETVQLRVMVRSESPQRLTVPPSDLIRVAPNQSVTVNIRPEATSNGIVQVNAYAVTESGSRVTLYTPITIEVTELGFLGGVVVVASAAVLLATTALRIFQMRRKHRTGAAQANDGGSTAARSAAPHRPTIPQPPPDSAATRAPAASEPASTLRKPNSTAVAATLSPAVQLAAGAEQEVPHG